VGTDVPFQANIRRRDEQLADVRWHIEEVSYQTEDRPSTLVNRSKERTISALTGTRRTEEKPLARLGIALPAFSVSAGERQSPCMAAGKVAEVLCQGRIVATIR